MLLQLLHGAAAVLREPLASCPAVRVPECACAPVCDVLHRFLLTDGVGALLPEQGAILAPICTEGSKGPAQHPVATMIGWWCRVITQLQAVCTHVRTKAGIMFMFSAAVCGSSRQEMAQKLVGTAGPRHWSLWIRQLGTHECRAIALCIMLYYLTNECGRYAAGFTASAVAKTSHVSFGRELLMTAPSACSCDVRRAASWLV